jgi:hypothetical protein
MSAGIHAALQHDSLCVRVLQSEMSDEAGGENDGTRRIRLSKRSCQVGNNVI